MSSIREWIPEVNIYYANRRLPLPSNLAEIRKTHAEYSSRKTFAPVATKPSIEPGFWYTLKSNKKPNPAKQSYIKRDKLGEEDCTVFETVKDGQDGPISVWTTEWGMALIVKPDDTWTRMKPAMRMLRFPLRVGDSWTDTVVIGISTKIPLKFKYDVRITDYESVNVLAGTFMAYK
jgi:hypothetical protein